MFTLGPALVAGAPTDSSWSSVALLVNGDGNTVSDRSTAARSLTATAVSASATQAKWNTYSANFTTLATSNLACGTGFNLSGSFTVEAWVYYTNEASAGQILWALVNGTTDWLYLAKVTNGTNSKFGMGLRLGGASSSIYQDAPADPGHNLSANTWHFVQVVRDSGGANPTRAELYVNGAYRGYISLAPGVPDTSATFQLGVVSAIGNSIVGYVDDFRATVGVARSTSVPAAPWPVG